MTIHRTSKTGNFTISDNGFSCDQNLDWDAKGLLIYLLTKPDHWRINKTNLINAVDGAGETRVESILKKLESAGYLIRWRFRNSKGQIIHDCEILESFKQYENVRNALIESNSGDKTFQITTPQLGQCGSIGGKKTAKSQKPFGTRKAKNAEILDEELTPLVPATHGEHRGGLTAPLVNTDSLKEKTELSLSPKGSLSSQFGEREIFANASKSEEDLQKMQILEDAIATEPELPKQNPTLINKTQTVEGQYSAAPPEIFGIKRWEDFKGPGLVQPFWDSVVGYGQKMDKVPTLIDVWAQEQIRKNGQLYWKKYQAAEAKRQAAEAALAAQTIAQAQPEEPREMPMDAIARIMQAQGLTPADVLPEVKSEYKAVFNRLPSDPQEAWDLLSRAQLSIIATFLEKKYAPTSTP